SKRAAQGKDTDIDKAILHAHKTRVEGSKRISAAAGAFNALDPTRDPTVGVVKAPKKKETYVLPKKVSAAGIDIPLRDVEKAVKTVGKGITAVGEASSKGYESIHAPKVISNIPKDAAEIAVTTPTSIVKLGQTAVTKPEKVPGMLAAPYKELAAHPGKFISEHPVSAALMAAPVVRVPGRAAGRAARLTGKQTLARPTAHFPGTNLREQRVGSRDITVRAVQSAVDKRRLAKGKGRPVMKQKHV